MEMTSQQAGWVQQAWNKRKKIGIVANFTATCPDGTRLRLRLDKTK